MSIVLVTGSSGFIGTAATTRLAADHEVIGLDGKAPETLGSLRELVPLDLTSDASVGSALDHVRDRYGDRIASVLHLAAYYDFSGEPSPLYDEVTVRGTERLLERLRGFHVEQFVFSSTMLVHAPTQPGAPIHERSPLDPKWDYPASKVKTEEVIRAKAGPIPTVILRIAGVYDDLCHSIPIARQIQRVFERKVIGHVFPGDTSHGNAFVHLDDLVDLFARVIARRAQLGEREVFLAGEPDVMSYDQLQRDLARLIHGQDWETRTIPKAVAKAGAWLQDHVPGEEPFIKPWMIELADDHFELDVSRAREELGWVPRRSLRSTLPRIVARLKDDPAAWYRENELEPPFWLTRRLASASPATMDRTMESIPVIRTPEPRLLGERLRNEGGDALRMRRGVLALSLIATSAAHLISLFQLGIVRRMPDPPGRVWSSARVNSSEDAHRWAHTPDGTLMLTSYAVTATLATMGMPDRAQRTPWVPLAMAAKTWLDAAVGLALARTGLRNEGALCAYCTLATVCSIVSAAISTPEAVRAVRTLRSG